MNTTYIDGIGVLLAGLIGLIIGSFINVVIYRTPKIMLAQWQAEIADFIAADNQLSDTIKDQIKAHYHSTTKLSLSIPRSQCVRCHTPIAWHHNIPVLGYVCLRGRCACCQAIISPIYPIIEIITALLSVLVIHRFGINAQGGLSLVFVWYLIALSMIDYQTKLLPDRLLVPLLAIGLLANVNGIFSTPSLAIFGLVLGFGVFWAINAIFKLITNKDGMGLGDAKLLGVLGAWVGVFYLPMMIFIAAMLGLVVGVANKYRQDEAFAFGPYLAIAGVVCLLYGKTIYQWCGFG